MSDYPPEPKSVYVVSVVHHGEEIPAFCVDTVDECNLICGYGFFGDSFIVDKVPLVSLRQREDGEDDE